MRRLLAIALIGLAVLGAFAPPPAHALQPPVQESAPTFLSLDPWFVNDRWTYETRAVTQFADGTRTDSTLTVDTVVTEVRDVTVRGNTSTVYNATTTGTVVTTGQIVVPGIGPRTFDLTGTTSGWVWTDRSDLAVVATNQTGTATGVAHLGFPFGDAPITADGATTVMFLPPQEDFDFPLETGDAWTFNGTVNTTGYAHVRVAAFIPYDNTTDLAGDAPNRWSSWFNGTANVTVPAGSFVDAAHIHTVAAANSWTGRWYHGSVKNVVRSETHTVYGPSDYVHLWVNLTAYSLAMPGWPGTISLNPSRVNPGGWITANGTANLDEDLIVRIPAIGAAFAARSDSTGAWSLRVRSPTIDDFTPANSDVGSHGVLVHPAASPQTADIASLQLILPDLFANPADVTVSDPNPVGGVPVDVNGTVHASPAVGVLNDFNVTLVVDGVEIGRFTVPGLPAGGSRTARASWTPAPGWHTLSLRADPEGVIAETDEGNNTATRSVFVSGPDLVLWNVTVESETSVSFADPASVGFVAPAIQGRLGGIVNVTMSPRNVGAADAPAGWVVQVVETQGLRGPPVGPVVWESTAIAPLPAGSSFPPATARWFVPGRAGVYHWNVTIDATGIVDEESEANNTVVVVVNVSGPDYVLVSVFAPAKATVGSSHFLDVTVRNDGQLDGDRAVTLAAYEGASPTPFYATPLAPLSVSESVWVPVPWTAPSPGAVVTIRIAVDPEGTMEEMIETNNDASVAIDVRDPPTTAIAWDGPNVTTPALFVTSATIFSLTALDRSGEGLTTYYRLDGTWTAYAGPFPLAAEGPHLIEYWSVDGLGGEETPQLLAVTVDHSPPETTLSAGNRTGDRVTVSLAAVDAGVGLAYIQYHLGDGSWTTYAGPFTLAGYGTHNVTYRAVDRLDHAEAPQTVTLTIQRAPASSVNLKPLLAAVFAVCLFLLGGMLGRSRGWSLASPRTVAALFALAELATGIISTLTPALAVPPLGLGLAVDLAIFLAGLGAIAFLRRPSGADPATDK